ncbi:MAG: carbamoyltransferase [Gammaproteobacteria bacterium]|nr:MAG: carbamoyltransferase [Gammaproteobacteria bacterium]
MKILGISGAVFHDASAALVIDGETIAAAEEERFIRDKHAKGRFPLEASKFCMNFSGVDPKEIDVVAMPYAKIPLTSPARWHYARRYWYAPDRSVMAILAGNRRFYRNVRMAHQLMDDLGMDRNRTKLVPVEHHLTHASSAYHLSGFDGKCAIIGIDGKGEYATTFFGYGENGQIHKIKEFYDPDSLGGLYAAMTEYLGFEMLDGEFKVMGMAPYGDPDKYDLSRLIDYSSSDFHVNTQYTNVVGLRRYKQNGKGYFFSPKLIDWLGPKREGDEIDDPYIDYAASIQKILEDVSLDLIDHYVGDIIRETGKVCFAGGVALNVKLNQKIIAMPGLKELFVQPAAGDAGTALGAATYVSNSIGETVKPMEHVYLGPSYTNEQCIAACEKRTEKLQWRQLENTPVETAKILADGNPVAWFQGRMEFGPRALGNRSILGDPGVSEIADRINAQIKYRERWRPFCPSMLDSIAPEIIQTEHPSPYMTFAFTVAEQWKDRIPEGVHEDGTARTQIVTEKTNPRYHALLRELESLKGYGVVLNTSLNRRGEPMICSPDDALNMFFGSDLEYLVMEDILITKK